jgi:signal transduction histidine kinase
MNGSGKIEISFKTENLSCSVYIKDQGPGIPQNKLKTIFKPGYSTKTRGWGLGLSLAKRIIEEYHKGKISVVESSSKGTTFELKFRKGIAES